MSEKKKSLETAMEGEGKVENKFSKNQLLSSERFRDRRDLVEALLDETERYTVKAVEEKIEKYMKGRVE